MPKIGTSALPLVSILGDIAMHGEFHGPVPVYRYRGIGYRGTGCVKCHHMTMQTMGKEDGSTMFNSLNATCCHGNEEQLVTIHNSRVNATPTTRAWPPSHTVLLLT